MSPNLEKLMSKPIKDIAAFIARFADRFRNAKQVEAERQARLAARAILLVDDVEIAETIRDLLVRRWMALAVMPVSGGSAGNGVGGGDGYETAPQGITPTPVPSTDAGFDVSTGMEPGTVAGTAPATPQPSGGSQPSEGIDADVSQEVANTAVTVAQDYDDKNVTYQMGGDASAGGDTSDCSHFVNDVLQRSGVDVPYTPTADMADSPYFQEVSQSDARPGDVIVQGEHMGIYTGTDANGAVRGVQMGNHGAQSAPWGEGGWFKDAGDMTFYRPQPKAK